jgi:hypothetical protein
MTATTTRTRRGGQHGYDSPVTGGENPTPLRYVTRDAIFVYLGQMKSYNRQSVPEGGCQGDEYRAVVAVIPTTLDHHYLENLDDEALTRASQDGRVTKLMADWKRCMKAAGWQYADPKAPFEYWSSRRGGDKERAVVSNEEKKSASADLACKASTGLLGTWLAADIAYQTAIVEREGQRLQEYRALLDRMVANANRIVAEG